MNVTFAAHSLGQDYARFRLRRDTRAPEAFLEGYDAYSGPRTTADTFTKKWLSLRLNAIKRGRVLDEAVTPEAISTMTGPRCPVSLQPFDFRTPGSPGNPSVDRVINDGTYALGNLLVVTQRVNRAKGEQSFYQVAEIAQSGDDAFGLQAIEWARLCALMYGPWNALNGQRDPHIVPMATYIQPHSFFPTSQAVQLLMLQGTGANYREDSVAFWSTVTLEACGSNDLFTALDTAVLQAVRVEEYPPSIWLREEVFDAYVAWYNACSATIDRMVGPVLSKWVPAFDLGAMLAAWRVSERPVAER